MGNEALCRVEVDGEIADAKVLLETDALIVRGAMKLLIPLREIASVEADGDVLRVAWGGRRGAFHVGPQAAKWAQKIRNPKSVLDKIGIKPAHRVSISGTLDPSFVEQLAAKVTEVATTPKKESDVIFVAAETREELARLATLRKSLKADGAIWVIRPKGTSAITEADVMAAGKVAGLVDVKVVKFSETHTAEKFVIPVAKR